MNERLARQGRHLSLSPAAIRWLQQDYDARFGARDLARDFRAHVLPALARTMLSEVDSAHLYADLHDNTLVIRPDNYVK
ncbi:MAG: hypothetical protein IBX53_06385 [Halomonas sp.]|uniref:hypothetical protein n=1 Tax=Halomonas sp. TaxID=1486246 RepID=UPI0019E55B0F|nr:hypothetical protein [Halomonas sp.]MBE0488689.1 hypothetical protein [Halomonas sp.]